MINTSGPAPTFPISITDSNGRMYTLREMMLQLRQKLGGLSEAEQGAAAAAIFGTNAMSGWLAVINSSEADMNKLAGAIDTCSYNIDEISDAVEASGVKWGKYADKAWMATGNGIQGLTDEIIYNLTKVGTSAEDLQDTSWASTTWTSRTPLPPLKPSKSPSKAQPAFRNRWPRQCRTIWRAS